MRTISQNAVNAFLCSTKFGEGNTTVLVEPNVTILVLFGNKIAYRYNDPEKPFQSLPVDIPQIQPLKD